MENEEKEPKKAAIAKTGRQKRISGTTSTVLDGKSICDIISACQHANVSKLKFQDLEVTFGAVPVVHNVPRVTEQLGSGPVSMELSTEQEEIMKAAEDADMIHLDPMGWEQHEIDRLVHQNRSLNGRS